MTTPQFSVGEAVYLVTIDGKDNGEAIVLEVEWPTTSHCPGRPGYALTIPQAESLCWCECVLRKRPPPDEEFRAFMGKINLQPEKVDA